MKWKEETKGEQFNLGHYLKSVRRRVCRQVPLALPLTTSGRYRARSRLGCLPPPSGHSSPDQQSVWPNDRLTGWCNWWSSTACGQDLANLPSLSAAARWSSPRSLSWRSPAEMVSSSSLQIPSNSSWPSQQELFTLSFVTTFLKCFFLRFCNCYKNINANRMINTDKKNQTNKQTCKILVIPHH